MAAAKDEYFSRLRRLFLRAGFFASRCAAAAAPPAQARAIVLALCFAAGVGGYFALPEEPPLWVGGVVAGGGAVLVLRLLYRGSPQAGSAVMVAAIAAGFWIAQIHTLSVTAPVWERQSQVRLSGRIIAVEERDRDRRLILTDLEIDGAAPEQTPERVRLSVRPGAVPAGTQLLVGTRITLRAGLMPPPVPSVPGGYDFQRAAWFERIGAVGYSLGVLSVLSEENRTTLWAQAVDRVERLRLMIGKRLREGLGGAEGAVAAALVTGEMGAIPEETVVAYRASGLAHMLSISGLHFSLAAATVLVVLRAGLALVPPLALRWDIKKISALLALLMMTVYLVISGASIPAQRAYVTGAVMVAAILVDRSALSLHVLGLSALIVLLLRPDALLSPSFQMSYAAVLVLIVTFDVWGVRWSRWRARARGPLGASGRAAAVYMMGVVVSTSVAGLATAPFSIFHFQTYSAYGVLANMTAIPLVAVCIMPGLLLAVLLMPFGWEGLTFPVLGQALWAVEQVARWVAELPGAVLPMPPLTMPMLLLAVAGFLGVCLWQGRGRWLGGAVMAVAFSLPVLFPEHPLAVVHGDGRLQAIRSGDGLVLSPGRANGFARDSWIRRWGEGAGEWTETGLIGGDGISLRCDADGCLYTPAGMTHPLLGLARTAAAVAEDCGQVVVLVSAVSVPPWSQLRQGCAETRLIDGWNLRRFGTHVVSWGSPGAGGAGANLRIETVAQAQGDRPWSLLGRERARQARLAAERQSEQDETGEDAEAAPVPPSAE